MIIILTTFTVPNEYVDRLAGKDWLAGNTLRVFLINGMEYGLECEMEWNSFS